jgi:flagellar protein FliL
VPQGTDCEEEAMAKAAAEATAAPTEAPGAGEEEAAEAGKGSKKKLLLIAGLAVVLIGGGVGGFLFWKSRSAQHATEAAKPKPPAPLQFHALDPPFVVNFQGAQLVRFLQLDVRLASRELETIELLKANDPVIRNDLLLLFGGQDANALSTLQGKEKLRKEALAVARRVVKSAGGKADSVEAVFFTSFVMQ